MHRSAAVGLVLLGLISSAFAQQPAGNDTESRIDVFGGYSYLRESQRNWNGWNVGLAGNINRWFAIAADFDGHYHSESGLSVFGDTLDISGHEYGYTAGPRVSLRNKSRLTPFAFAMLGGLHLGATSGAAHASLNGFAMHIGGGLDVRLNERLSARVIQADAA